VHNREEFILVIISLRRAIFYDCESRMKINLEELWDFVSNYVNHIIPHKDGDYKRDYCNASKEDVIEACDAWLQVLTIAKDTSKLFENLINDDASNCSSDSDTDGDGILLTTRRSIEQILDLIANLVRQYEFKIASQIIRKFLTIEPSNQTFIALDGECAEAIGETRMAHIAYNRLKDISAHELDTFYVDENNQKGLIGLFFGTLQQRISRTAKI